MPRTRRKPRRRSLPPAPVSRHPVEHLALCDDQSQCRRARRYVGVTLAAVLAAMHADGWRCSRPGVRLGDYGDTEDEADPRHGPVVWRCPECAVKVEQEQRRQARWER